MSKYYSQLLSISLLTAITLETSSVLALPTNNLEEWRFYPRTAQLEITLSSGETPHYFYLPQPARLVLDIPNTKVGSVSSEKSYSGNIQKIRVGQLDANVTRIVLDLAPGTSIQPNQIQLQPISPNNSTRWVLRPVILPNKASVPNQPISTKLPPVHHQIKPQLPLVTVPPLNSANSFPGSNNALPPATFPKQSDNLNSVTIPSNSGNQTNKQPEIKVIQFGQPLPKK